MDVDSKNRKAAEDAEKPDSGEVVETIGTEEQNPSVELSEEEFVEMIEPIEGDSEEIASENPAEDKAAKILTTNWEDEPEAEDRFVWHDEQGYKKAEKRLAIIILIAAVAGLAFYIPLRAYTDAYQFAIAIGVIVFLILFRIFYRRIMNNNATYIRYDERLYRLSSANRGLTRIALDNEAEAPYFIRDFMKAVKTNSCWIIDEVRMIEEDKKGYELTCMVIRNRTDEKTARSFFLEKGYNDMDALMEEFRARKE